MARIGACAADLAGGCFAALRPPLEEDVPQNPTLPRAHVHTLSEACANGPAVEAASRRALDLQPRLVRFFRSNLPQMSEQTGEVSLYLLSVVIRVFTGSGGQLSKVGAGEIATATQKLQAVAAKVLPGNEGFPERVRAVADRAQPNLLDEALWALFERERQEREVEVPHDQAALLFLMLWASVEALNLVWRAPASPTWLVEATKESSGAA